MTYKAIAALAVALAFYLAGPQLVSRTPSAASAAEKQYRLADLQRLCDAAGSEWPKYHQKDNVLIRDRHCHIYDVIVFSDQDCGKGDSATVISCLRSIVGRELDVATSEGEIAGPPCKTTGMCTFYFDFYDPETNYLKESDTCGFHIGGVAKVTDMGRVAFGGSVSIKRACH